MSFSSVWGFLSLHQHLNRHIDFQERVGGWHSPPAQVPDAAFRESGAHFPGDDPTEGPCVLLFLCICFGLFWFFLLFCCFFCFFCFSFAFFCFLPQLFAISFKKYPVLEVPNSDRGPSLSAGHLSTWQAWASTLRVLRLHGFTSDLPFQV